MRIVAALGGNALLHRGQALTVDNQRKNIRSAANALAPLAREHSLIITHGNGPQVGLLALQGEAYKPEEAYPLDVLDAETEGMIGYLIEQELGNHLAGDKRVATLLTQIEVDPTDPAFHNPSKPIGPIYDQAQAEKLSIERGWTVHPDGEHFRRVVASPAPLRILEIGVIELLVDQGITVICAGGGGIPVVRRNDGSLRGVEAVIDKDWASALLSRELAADAFLMLTDVDAVYADWNQDGSRAIRSASAQKISALSFASGSMRPKVEAACEFVTSTGAMAGIGRLEDAQAILDGAAGTLISSGADAIQYRD